MRNTLLCFLLLSSSFNFCFGQQDSTRLEAQSPSAQRFTAKRSTYIELNGNGSTFSINWDQILLPQATWKLGVRAGFDFFGLFVRRPQVLSELYVLRGNGNHHLEVGAGATYTIVDQYKEIINSQETWKSNGPQLWLVSRLGYRYQRPKGGLVFRAGMTPSLRWGDASQKRLFMGLGLSLGRSF